MDGISRAQPARPNIRPPQRRDFDRLGFYDDGWLTISESSALLADRLDTASVDHTPTIIEDATHDHMTPEGLVAHIDFIVNG